MDKEAILAAVAQALDGMGMSAGSDDEYGEGDGVGADNSVPIWSKLQMPKMGPGMGTLHDKSALMGQTEQDKPPTVDNYGMPVDDQSEEMMSAMGVV